MIKIHKQMKFFIVHSTYVVIAPSDVRPGVPISVSVNILQAHANVNVKANLIEKSSNNHVATTHGTFSQSKSIYSWRSTLA